jgi:hypothetical protein
MVVCVYNPSYSGGGGRKITSSKLSLPKLVRPYLKNKIQIKGVGEWFKWWRACLTCGVHKALGSICKVTIQGFFFLLKKKAMKRS